MKKLSIIIFIFFLFSSFSSKQITWVAIGDSITYLNDHTNETGNRLSKGYLSRVVEKLPNYHYINQGHNGWTSQGIAKQIDSLGLVKADVYTILLGTNDWWHGGKIGVFNDYANNTGLNTMFGSFRIIVDKIRSLNPAAKVVLLTPMQRADFVYINNMKNNAYGSYKEKDGQSLEQFAAGIVAIAKFEGFKVIDLYNESEMKMNNLVKFKRLKDPKTSQYKNFSYPGFINVPFNPETDEYPYPPEAMDMTYDGLHPSDKGCEIIASMLVKVFKKL